MSKYCHIINNNNHLINTLSVFIIAFKSKHVEVKTMIQFKETVI